MNILVSGGCGFIGSAVCRMLVAQGQAVLNLDKLTYAATGSSMDDVSGSRNYAFVRGDVADQEVVRGAFERCRPDVVIHLAAESHVDRSIAGPFEFVHTNVVGSMVMLEEALAYWARLDASSKARFRFVQVSTDEVFGSLGPTGAFTETTPYDPRSPYSASKAAADHLASAWFHTYGLPVIITNCSNNYGPYHFPEKLIPLTILNALEGRALPVYGDGGNVRDWLYVDDHARALWLVARNGRPGRTYNIGGRNERTNLQVVESICDLLDEFAPHEEGARRRLITFVADRPGHDRRYAVDAARIEEELGWRAEESFETGLRKTVRWFIERRDWWEPLRRRYGGERLGAMRLAAAP